MYPLLLLFSTALAGAFCYLYLNKPVFAPPSAPPPRVVVAPAQAPVEPPPQVVPTPEESQPAAAAPEATEAAAAAVAQAEPSVPSVPSAPAAPPLDPAIALAAAVLPTRDHFPGDAVAVAPPASPEPADPQQALPALASPFEETNLQVQHILTAEAANGAISRIVLDVPVLYQTGQLAWTENEVAEARNLLGSLAEHQDKTRALREEGELLLAAWNRLIERSIPIASLRADSPALPANQHAGATGSPLPAFDSTESIQLQALDP
jgi:hypothetical protein